MTVEHLLPCTCGRSVAVQSRQAGQRVPCECGQLLDVPTMRDLSRLPQRETVGEPLARAWTSRKALLSLGVLIAVIGFSLTGYLYWQMPSIDPVARGREIEEMPLYLTWQWWRYYERGMPRVPSDDFILTRQREAYLRRWSYFTIGIGTLGLLVLGIGALWPTFARQRM